MQGARNIYESSIDEQKAADSTWQRRIEPLLWERRHVATVACAIEDIIAANDNDAITPEIEAELVKLSPEQQSLFRHCLEHYFLSVSQNKLIEEKVQQLTKASNDVVTPETMGRRYFFEKVGKMPLGIVTFSRDGGCISLIADNVDATTLGNSPTAGGTYYHHHRFAGARGPAYIITNYRDYNDDIIRHEKRHFIHSQVLNIYKTAYQSKQKQTNNVSRKGSPTTIFRAIETSTERKIKDELIAYLLDGSKIENIKKNLHEDSYKHLFKHYFLEITGEERIQLDYLLERIWRALSFFEEALPLDRHRIAHNSRELHILAYQLIEIPLAQWPLWLGHVRKFYYKNERKIFAKIEIELPEAETKKALSVSMSRELEQQLHCTPKPIVAIPVEIHMEDVESVTKYCSELADRESQVAALAVSLDHEYTAINRYIATHIYARDGDDDYYTQALKHSDRIAHELNATKAAYDLQAPHREEAKKYIAAKYGIASAGALTESLGKIRLFLSPQKKRLLKAAADGLIFASEDAPRQAKIKDMESILQKRAGIVAAINNVFGNAAALRGKEARDLAAKRADDIVEQGNNTILEIFERAREKTTLGDEDIRQLFQEQRETLYRECFLKNPQQHITTRAEHATARALVADTVRTHELLIEAHLAANDINGIDVLEKRLGALKSQADQIRNTSYRVPPEVSFVLMLVEDWQRQKRDTHDTISPIDRWREMQKVAACIQTLVEERIPLGRVETEVARQVHRPSYLVPNQEHEAFAHLKKDDLILQWPPFRDSACVQQRFGQGDMEAGKSKLLQVDQAMFELCLKQRDHTPYHQLRWMLMTFNNPTAICLNLLTCCSGSPMLCKKEGVAYLMNKLETSISLPFQDDMTPYQELLRDWKEIYEHFPAHEYYGGEKNAIKALRKILIVFVQACLRSDNSDLREYVGIIISDFTDPGYDSLADDLVNVYHLAHDQHTKKSLMRNFSTTLQERAQHTHEIRSATNSASA